MHYILTIILTVAVFIYMKSKTPKREASFNIGKNKIEEPQQPLPDDHPLKHEKFKLIDHPLGHWSDGYVDIHDVLDYIFKSPKERSLAITRLLQAGYGQSKTDFLYFKDEKVTVNGAVFNTLEDAKEFLKSSAIKKLRVFILAKNEFREEIKVPGISYYMVPWDKRDLPDVEL